MLTGASHHRKSWSKNSWVFSPPTIIEICRSLKKVFFILSVVWQVQWAVLHNSLPKILADIKVTFNLSGFHLRSVLGKVKQVILLYPNDSKNNMKKIYWIASRSVHAFKAQAEMCSQKQVIIVKSKQNLSGCYFRSILAKVKHAIL